MHYYVSYSYCEFLFAFRNFIIWFILMHLSDFDLKSLSLDYEDYAVYFI